MTSQPNTNAEQEPQLFWAAWHPKHEFELPDFYSGNCGVFASLDACARLVRQLNEDAGTTNRNGWRATKVRFVRVTG